jgi:hypothetical protein
MLEDMKFAEKEERLVAKRIYHYFSVAFFSNPFLYGRPCGK